jgi:membrane protein
MGKDRGVEPHVSRRDFATMLAQRAFAEFREDHCPQLASSIAYHVLFSIFPLAIVAVGATSIVLHATGLQASLVDSIVATVPLSADGDRQLRELLLGATSRAGGLGLLAIVGLVYSASGMMTSLRFALNRAWDVEAVRPFLLGKLIDLGLVFLVATLGLCSLGLTIALRFVDKHAAASGLPGVGWLLWAVSIAVPLAVGFVVILFLYRAVPAAEVRVRDAWPAALLVAVLLVVGENLFALYVGNFANYNVVYGSLGAVIAFMFFVYLASDLFLLGAEMASEWPRVRSALERGETPQPGPPLARKVRTALSALWTRGRAAETDADDETGRAA